MCQTKTKMMVEGWAKREPILTQYILVWMWTEGKIRDSHFPQFPEGIMHRSWLKINKSVTFRGGCNFVWIQVNIQILLIWIWFQNRTVVPWPEYAHHWGTFHYWLTFGTDVGAGDAHFDAVLLHFHLVAGTSSDAGTVVHHKVICENRVRELNVFMRAFPPQMVKDWLSFSHICIMIKTNCLFCSGRVRN